MNIDVEYIDQAGTVHNQIHRLTKLTFAKHLAVAGQGYAPIECVKCLFFV